MPSPLNSLRLVAVFVTVVAALLFQGCGNDGPGAPNSPRNGSTGRPSPGLEPLVEIAPNPDYQEVIAYQTGLWQALFGTPYSLAQSGYLLGTLPVAAGSYGGTTTVGGSFQLEIDVVEIDETAALAARTADPAARARVEALGLALARFEGRIRTPLHTRAIEGGIRRLVVNGEVLVQLAPWRDFVDRQDLAVDLPRPADAAAPGSGLPDLTSDARSDCISGSSFTPATAVTMRCAPGRILNAECARDCRDNYTDTMNDAIEDYCTDAAAALTTLGLARNSCRETWKDDEIEATAACLAHWLGCLLHIKAVRALNRCLDDADDAFDTELQRLRGHLQTQSDSAWEALKDCLRDCCEPLDEPRRRRGGVTGH